MKKIRYQLINEEAEMPLDFKKRYKERSYEDASVADFLCITGMQNGGYSVIGTYDDFESASLALSKLTTQYRIVSGMVNKFYVADIYYVEEQELVDEEDEEWQPTGNYDFAKEEEV